jgi:hypothetical protein
MRAVSRYMFPVSQNRLNAFQDNASETVSSLHMFTPTRMQPSPDHHARDQPPAHPAGAVQRRHRPCHSAR